MDIFLVFVHNHLLSFQQVFFLLEHNISNGDQQGQIILMIPNNFPNLNSQYFLSIYGEPGTRLDVLSV